MKKFFITIIALVCAAMISGCCGDADFVDVIVKKLPKREQKTESAENVIVNSQDEAEEKKPLSTEKIINIFLKNYDVWKFGNDEDSVMGGHGYLIMDLDFDGVCELITSQGAGSGVFSTNKYYRINEENAVVEVPVITDDIFGYDLYVMDNTVKLLKNPEDNSFFYYVRDYTRVGWGENGTYYGKLYMKDGIICEEPLLNEYHNEWDSNAENHIHSYEFEENGQWTECEKAVFEQKTAQLEEMNVNFTWKPIPGSDFDKSSEEEKREMFTQSYKSFSY